MSKLPAWQKKMPKSVMICGKLTKIRYNLKRGCSLYWSEHVIIVGCSEGKDDAIDGLVHEISECVHIELRQRFTKHGNCENGDFLFVMDHDRFEQHNSLLVAALRDCGIIIRK